MVSGLASVVSGRVMFMFWQPASPVSKKASVVMEEAVDH